LNWCSSINNIFRGSFYWNVSNTTYINFFDICSWNWNEILIINFNDYKWFFLNWFCIFECWSIFFWNRINWNVCFSVNFKCIKRTWSLWLYNSSINILCWIYFTNWNVSNSIMSNWFYSFILDWFIKIFIYFNCYRSLHNWLYRSNSLIFEKWKIIFWNCRNWNKCLISDCECINRSSCFWNYWSSFNFKWFWLFLYWNICFTINYYWFSCFILNWNIFFIIDNNNRIWSCFWSQWNKFLSK